MPPKAVYRFVTQSQAQPPSNRDVQRAVRSHVASASHPGHAPRRRRTPQTVPGEGVIELSSSPTEESLARRELPRLPESAQELPHSAGTNSRMVLDILSGVTFSPISNLATYHKPYLPSVMHHYIHHLTIPIPELDGSSAGPLFRAKWVPLVIYDPVIFQIVVLFAATHYATYANSRHFDHMFLELLSLKQIALSSLAQKVRTENDISDVLIAAAAKMASYEAIFGTAEAVSHCSLHK